MPQTRVNLPPEALEAMGDFKGAAEGIKRELDKLERELSRDMLRGRKIDEAKSTRADELRGRYESLSAQRDAVDAARKEAKKDVATYLKDAFNTHNPHGVVRRMLRMKIMPNDFGTLGGLLRDVGTGQAAKAIAGMDVKGSGASGQAFLDATVKDLASRGALPGSRLSALGAKLQDLAADPAASSRMFLANAVIQATVRKIDQFWEDTKRSADAAKSEASRNATFARENRYRYLLNGDELHQMQIRSKAEANRTKRLSIAGSLFETLWHNEGWGTPHADLEATQAEALARRKFMLERTFGHLSLDDRSALRRAVDRRSLLDAAGEGSSKSKFINVLGAFFNNVATGGATRRAIEHKLMHEEEVKLYEAKQKKREDANWERSQNPLYRNVDMERSLHLRTLAQWRQERALQWNPI